MVDAGLASLSDSLFTAGIGVYSTALVGYCGEYAFGTRGRVAASIAGTVGTVGTVSTAKAAEAAEALATRRAVAAQPVLVGAAVPAGPGGSVGSVGTGAAAPAAPAAPADAPSPAGASPARVALARRFGWVAVALTVVGLVLHAASLAVRGASADRLPLGNMYEFCSAVGLVSVAAFLAVLARTPKLRHLGVFVMLPVVALMFLAGTVLYTRAAPLIAALNSYWLAIHVTGAILATGIFLVSFVATVLYLVRERHDRAVAAGQVPARFPVNQGGRLPEAGVLDSVAYRTAAFAFPIWTFAIICGAIWAEAAWGRYWNWDPKETWAFVSWVVYAAYLHARATAGWKGVKAGGVNLLAFGTMVFNFFVVNIVISGLHSYAGLS